MCVVVWRRSTTPARSSVLPSNFPQLKQINKQTKDGVTEEDTTRLMELTAMKENASRTGTNLHPDVSTARHRCSMSHDEYTSAHIL